MLCQFTMPRSLCYCLLLLVFSVFQDVVLSETCDVNPVSYRYKAGSIMTSESPNSCSSDQQSGDTILVCQQSTIRNGDEGPTNFSDASTSDYYKWNFTGGKIEFTFSQNITFTKVIVYFYVNMDPNLALPKLRLLSRDGATFPNCETKNTPPGIIDRSTDIVTPESVSSGRHIQETSLAGTSNALLLCILPAKRYKLALTEIKFCTNDTIITTTTPTTSGSISPGGVSQEPQTTAQLVATSEPDLGARRNNLPIGIPVGVIVGVAFVTLVVLAVLIVVWRCKAVHLQKYDETDSPDSKDMISPT